MKCASFRRSTDQTDATMSLAGTPRCAGSARPRPDSQAPGLLYHGSPSPLKTRGDCVEEPYDSQRRLPRAPRYGLAGRAPPIHGVPYQTIERACRASDGTPPMTERHGRSRLGDTVSGPSEQRRDYWRCRPPARLLMPHRRDSPKPPYRHRRTDAGQQPLPRTSP